MYPLSRRLPNNKSYRLLTAPTVEPVSVVDLKAWLRIDNSDDDDLLDSLISSARRMAEEFTKRALITQTWQMVMDRFPGVVEFVGEGFCVAPTPCLVDDVAAIKLTREPIQAVTKIETINPSNVTTTVDASVYALDVTSAKIMLNEGFQWPTDLRDRNAVIITWSCGYGSTGSAVPETIKQAIKMHCTSMYEDKAAGDMPQAVKTLLGSYQSAEAFGV